MANGNDNGNNDAQAQNRRASQVTSILSMIPGFMLGLMFFHFSVADKQVRDLYVAYGFTILMLVCMCGLCVKMIKVMPGLDFIWASAMRSLGGKKKFSRLEKSCWSNLFLGAVVVGFLHFLRMLGT